MIARLLDILVCPACLPAEHALDLAVAATRGERDALDVIEGELACPACGRTYTIRGGVASLLPPDVEPDGHGKYEDPKTVASYLWSHYADLRAAPESSEVHQGLVAMFPQAAPGTFALDAGCAVGRLAFELAAKGYLAVGVDLSRSFVETARRLSTAREAFYDEPVEGELSVRQAVRLPARLMAGSAEFIQASVLALPFRSGSFAAAASCNIVDKVPDPAGHLAEVSRTCAAQAVLTFADPFSWSEDWTPRERWLGGFTESGAPRRGLDGVKAVLAGHGWSVHGQGYVWWKIRTHENHFELIRSLTLHASRKPA